MKYIYAILIFFTASSILLAENLPKYEEAAKLNQRLELISKVNSLTDSLNRLNKDHIEKLNKYAGLIEEKDLELKKQKDDDDRKIDELKTENQKDRESFNKELENQRVCLREQQSKCSDSIERINSEYLDEISNLKEKYESLLKKSASDYQKELFSLQNHYADNISTLKNDFKNRSDSLESELTDFRNNENSVISNIQKRLSAIENQQKSNISTPIADKGIVLKDTPIDRQSLHQEEHNYFYRLIHKVI